MDKDEIKSFIRRITLDLQRNREILATKWDLWFQEAYELYVKYSVEENTKQNMNSQGLLIKRLESIAKINQDSFRYKIEITPTSKGLRYYFKATETADGHDFLVGAGETEEDAILEADKEIENACKSWGYKNDE